MKIIGIEIENPYRYRAYFVGERPEYDIKNHVFKTPYYGRVRSIKSSKINSMDYDVTFEDESFLIIHNCSSLITHYVRDDENE